MTPLRHRMIEDMPAWRRTGSFTISQSESGRLIFSPV